MARTLRNIYQLKVSLKGAKPPIWRRFLVDSSVKLPKLHETLQIVMGWTDTHLHQFVVGELIYGVPDPEWGFEEIQNEKNIRLDKLLKNEKDTLVYEYDFGDGWKHKITLEKIMPFDSGATLPICVKAKGACPPEDVGGIWGYYRFLEALNDVNHPEHNEYKEWVSGEFDPDAYDVQKVNEILTEIIIRSAHA